MATDEKKIRPEKVAIVEELATAVDASEYLFVVGFDSMTVSQFEALRGLLRGHEARIAVVKNSLFGRIAGDRGWDSLGKLTGANGIVTGAGEASDVAKTIKKFIADLDDASVKAGVLSGECLSAEQVKALADLPSREELYGKLVGTLAAPMTQLVGVMNQKVSSIVYVLKAIESKKQG